MHTYLSFCYLIVKTTRFYFNLLMQQEDMKTRFANYTYGRFRNRVTQLDITYASMKYIVATESLACDMTCTINNIGILNSETLVASSRRFLSFV